MSNSEEYSISEDIRAEILDKYPTKVARKRAAQVIVNKVEPDETVPVIKANTRTVPGIITQRGCCYAGCKGVVLGPTRDVINLTHGPIGCGFYSWLTRRNQTRPEKDTDHNFMTYCFSTDMQEEHIVFGGEKLLANALQEAYEQFHPRVISVFSTCPVGLIGDDIHQVCADKKKELGINIFAFSCEGYKGVSQSAGHHIANNQLFKHVIGLNHTPIEGKFKITLLGEYNIGGDAFLIEKLLEKCGITLQATFSGNSTMVGFERAHTADLNCVMCHRSINYVADMIEKKYGVPWIKVNFIGAESTAKSLRKIAQYFEDEELTERVEKVIAEEMAAIEPVRQEVYEHCKGETAMIFVGGSRAHHYQDLFAEIGMKTLAAGYEFAHRDDYEGRKILPGLQVDADSRNIEELEVEADPERYNPRKPEEKILELQKQGVPFKEYEGMMPTMHDGAMIVDDISEHETEKLIEKFKPSIFCAGIKEKYGIQKKGMPSKQLHSYDYGGPFATFEGAANFWLDIDRTIHTRIWSYIQAPWEKNPAEPTLEAKVIQI